MGNLCGKESSDPFAQPGRTVDSAPHPKSTSTVPRKVGGPPRTLGGSAGGNTTGTPEQQEDARRKAADAAEARARNSKKATGKLGSQLQEQKRQTRTDTLVAASKDERRIRDSDAAAEARNYN